jgi:hypothetical protein
MITNGDILSFFWDSARVVVDCDQKPLVDCDKKLVLGDLLQQHQGCRQELAQEWNESESGYHYVAITAAPGCLPDLKFVVSFTQAERSLASNIVWQYYTSCGGATKDYTWNVSSNLVEARWRVNGDQLVVFVNDYSKKTPIFYYLGENVEDGAILPNQLASLGQSSTSELNPSWDGMAWPSTGLADYGSLYKNFLSGTNLKVKVEE